MENKNSVGNENIDTPVNSAIPPVTPSVEVKPTPKLKTIPKYLYFVIPISLIIEGLLTYIFLNGGLQIFNDNGVFKLILNSELKRNINNQLVNTRTLVQTPTPTIIPIIKGQETYTISQGKTNGPKMEKAIINPHDPDVGTTQNFTLFTNHTIPVTGVTISVISDNKTQKHELSLSSGTPLKGQWFGSWKIDDTHLYTYAFTVEASDGTNTSMTGMAIR